MLRFFHNLFKRPGSRRGQSGRLGFVFMLPSRPLSVPWIFELEEHRKSLTAILARDFHEPEGLVLARFQEVFCGHARCTDLAGSMVRVKGALCGVAGQAESMAIGYWDQGLDQWRTWWTPGSGLDLNHCLSDEGLEILNRRFREEVDFIRSGGLA